MGHYKPLSALVFLILIASYISLEMPEPAAGADEKPNIVFIMGDDIGMWNISAYHRGMMAGRTPHIDELAAEAVVLYRQGSAMEKTVHRARLSADDRGHELLAG